MTCKKLRTSSSILCSSKEISKHEFVEEKNTTLNNWF